jgi:hypothetical protein
MPLAARVAESSDSCDHVLVKHPQVSTGLLIALANLCTLRCGVDLKFGSKEFRELPSHSRKFTAHLVPQLQNLQLYRRHSRGQDFERFHLLFQNRHALGQISPTWRSDDGSIVVIGVQGRL